MPGTHSKEQEETERAHGRGVGTGLAITAATAALLYKTLPDAWFEHMGSGCVRLLFATRLQVFPALTLIRAIVLVGKCKGAASKDPSDARAQEIATIASNNLQNTLEQFALHSAATVILSTHLTAETSKILPIMTVLFVAGRAIFWKGYTSDNPMKRAPGFAMGFFPSVIAIGACVVMNGIRFYNMIKGAE